MSLNNKKPIGLICLCGSFLGLSGCASITSEVICGNRIGSEVDACGNAKKVGDGIVYYLPKRDIRIDVSVSKSGSGGGGPKPEPMKVTVTIPNNRDAETLPDLNHLFLLRYSKNWIGDNNMAVGVSPLGLLTVTHADTINKINDIAANIAVDAAAISIGAGALLKTSDSAGSALPTSSTITGANFTPSAYSVTFDDIEVPDSCKVGSYSLLIDPIHYDKKLLTDGICGLSFDFQPVFQNALQNGNSNWIDHEGFFDSWDGFYDTSRIAARKVRNLFGFFPLEQYRWNSLPGIFYKQDIPYRINVHRSGDNVNRSSFLAFSPNASKIYFAPVTETLFTNNTSDITLVNGVVNSLKENTDSELLGLSKIPANVLGAYTNATGEIFSALGTVTKNQGTLQTDELSVLLNAQKITRCQMAIASNNLVGKTGDELTKAYSAIQAACGS